MRTLRACDFADLPWKNGLGVSSVIASEPPGAGYDAALWQVGTTSITADCPFSSLPGTDRQFTVIEGGGVELKCSSAADGVDLVKAVDTPFVPFAFRGDWKTDCRLLGGEVRVLNVMTRRGRAAAKLRIQRFAGPLLMMQPPGEIVLVVLLGGTARAIGDPVTLIPNDTVMLDSKTGGRCEIVAPPAGARVAVVRLTVPG